MSLTKVTLTGGTRDLLRAAFEKVNDIIDDLLSTSNGLGASCIGVEDSAGNLDAENVEDAIAEFYSSTATIRTLGDVLAENSLTTTGLTWGYKAGTIRYDNTITDVAAGTVSLTDNATNYVEVASDGTVYRNTSAFTAGRIPIRTVITLAGVQTTSTDKRAWFQGYAVPLDVATVAKGGTGVATLTDHGIMLGSGTDPVTILAAATNGQIPIGSTGADPTLATITATANETSVTNAAGSITIGLADDVLVPTSVTIPNEGLHILDSDASHDLIIKAGSNLSADRILTLTTGDSARGVTISANGTVMIGDGGTTKCWFYLNTAPTGWTIDATPADALLAVKGGSQAYNANGGTQVGTWTQLTSGSTTLTAAQSGVPAHTHTWSGGVTAGGSPTTYPATTGPTSGSTPTTNANATAAAAEGHTHPAPANTWRPLAQLGIICTMDA